MAGFLAGNPSDVVQSARIGEETFENIANTAKPLKKFQTIFLIAGQLLRWGRIGCAPWSLW